jgi:hypothetical protein
VQKDLCLKILQNKIPGFGRKNSRMQIPESVKGLRDGHFHLVQLRFAGQ